MAKPRKYKQEPEQQQQHEETVEATTNEEYPSLGQPLQTQTIQNPTATVPKERFYPGKQDIDSDLFRLQVAFMLKDMGYKNDPQDFVKVEHVHFFRTFDSNGKKQTFSNTVGGHFHPIVETQNEDGSVTIRALPAKKWVNRRKGNQVTKVMVDLEHDHHTHSVAYERSHQVKAREINPEFVKYQASLHKPAAVEGVFEK